MVQGESGLSYAAGDEAMRTAVQVHKQVKLIGGTHRGASPNRVGKIGPPQA
jgi:hypothetical protein